MSANADSLPSRRNRLPEVLLEVRHLVKSFDGKTNVLNGISFDVRRGEALVIMGEGGCGKSTLLRHLTGIQKPSAGSIRLFGQEIAWLNDRGMRDLRKRFGMLFHSGALLGSMTVADNVALPLRQHSKLSDAVIRLVVERKLKQVGMLEHSNKTPSQISVGQKKRVGLARALALDPELFLSDEATSGLDPIMTAAVDELTINLTRKIGAAAVLVVHEMSSVFRIASRILMMGSGDRRGTIVAEGTPEEIKTHPDPLVQQFVNSLNSPPTI